MTRSSALAFFQKVQTDPMLLARIRQMQAQDIRSLLRLAADVGYLFSPKDYQAALETNGELSEDARDRLARGHYVIPGLPPPPDANPR